MNGQRAAVRRSGPRWLSLAGLLAAASAFAAASPSATEGRALLEALEFPRDAPVGYSETQRSPMLKRAIESRGRVWLTADGILVMQMESPRLEQRRIEGEVLSIARSRRRPSAGEPFDLASLDFKRTLALKAERPAHLLLLAASALLHGNLDWLATQFEIAAVEAVAPSEQRQVRLTPKTAELAAALPAITLTVRGAALLEMDADRGRRGQQTLRFFPLPT